MKAVARFVSVVSKNWMLHNWAISILALGILMLLTAGELGPAMATFVPLGLYLCIFSVCMEFVWVARCLIAKLARKFT